MVTYCTNIHPGESWADIFSNLQRFIPAVREAVSPTETFPIGLRLSGRAALELDDAASDAFQQWCRREDCAVASVNGFPYGVFHGTPVKEDVYLPDWRQLERTAYTRRIADLLASWLPEGGKGCISTVPLGFRTAMNSEGCAQAMENLRRTVGYLAWLRRDTGRHLVLAVEPEPGCVVETTPDLVALFRALDLDDELRPHLGVCYDCCHQAVQFEDPSESLRLLEREEIPVAHVQVSSALRLLGKDLGRLARFCEPVYLHQAVARLEDGSLVRFNDLPEALASELAGVDEWRVHFHVPVFVGTLPECETTQPFLKEILPLFRTGISMEVETYTWSVLPTELRSAEVTDSIAREIRWTEGALRGEPAGASAGAVSL